MDVFIIIILLIYLHLDAPATVEKVQQACSLDPTMFVIQYRKNGCKRQ